MAQLDRVSQMDRVAQLDRLAQMDRMAQMVRVAQMDRLAQMVRVAQLDQFLLVGLEVLLNPADPDVLSFDSPAISKETFENCLDNLLNTLSKE